MQQSNILLIISLIISVGLRGSEQGSLDGLSSEDIKGFCSPETDGFIDIVPLSSTFDRYSFCWEGDEFDTNELPLSSSSSTTDTNNSNEMIYCQVDTCSYRCPCYFDLKSHGKNHGKQDKIYCKQCSKFVQYKAFMDGHQFHQKLNPISRRCKVCNKCSYPFQKIKSHMLSHTGNFNYCCSKCSYSSDSIPTIQMHFRAKHGTRRLWCTCTDCCKKNPSGWLVSNTHFYKHYKRKIKK